MENLRELVSKGKEYFDNKEYKRAETILKKVLDGDGRYADVYNMLGVISHVDGRFSNSIEYFKKAIEINPRYTEALLNLAVLYNDLGKYTEAKKLYAKLKNPTKEASAKIEPVLRGKLSNLHADIGDIYRSIGLYVLAIDEYEKALKLNPTYLDIRTKLGTALRDEGKFDQSLKELKAVLKAKPDYSPAQIELGITNYSMEKISDAKKCWKDCLVRDPGNKRAEMFLRLCEAVEKP